LSRFDLRRSDTAIKAMRMKATGMMKSICSEKLTHRATMEFGSTLRNEAVC
jgi:hypothetical protein